MSSRNKRKSRIGMVISNKPEKTAIVDVERQFVHPKYGKIVRQKKKYVAHDEKNECSIGDKVMLIETRPISKTKRWRINQIIEKVK